MKVAVLLALVAVASAVVPYDTLLTESYHERLRNIEIVNSNPSSTWVAGMNPYFFNKTNDYARKLCGTHMGGDILPVKTYAPEEFQAVPDNFDGRTAWPECPSFNEIRDQSACGSCWAFGAASAATDRWCVASKGAQQRHFSATDLLACCSSCGYGCQGGYPSSAWSWLQNTGIVTGGNYGNYSLCLSYPFQNCEHHSTGKYPDCSQFDYSTPKCTKSCDSQSSYSTPYAQDKSHFASAYSIQGEANYQQELMKYGSIEVAFSVYSDFLNYKSGVYKHQTGDYLGGHAVKLIGWGVENGVKYWLVANSWNNDWGFDGYFKILRGTNECGIENSGTAGLPAL